MATTDPNFDGVIDPTAEWADVPQASTEMLLLGGSGGPLNAQALALAKRTKFLKEQAEQNAADVSGVLARTDRAVLSFPDYASAEAAADTLPDGQEVEAPNADGRLSHFEVQSGDLVFRDFAPDAIRMQSYTALRAYTGNAQAVDITTPGVAGRFNRDDSDTTTADNGGTVIVDGYGRRWKRLHNGIVYPEWFGGSTSAAITAAAAVAFASGFVLSGSGTYSLTETINLRQVKLAMQHATFNIAHAGIGVILGGRANHGDNPPQAIGTVTRSVGSDSQTTPAVRCIGAKGQHISVESTEYFQVYADTHNVGEDALAAMDYSSAYSSFRLKRAPIVELTTNPANAGGAGNSNGGGRYQWINENNFYLNRTNFVYLSGTYEHNNNRFFEGTMEGVAAINIQVGSNNRFYRLRHERNPANPAEVLAITFAEGTFNNVVEASWQSSPSAYQNAPYGTDVGLVTVNDNGTGNSVVHAQENERQEAALLDLSPSTPFVSSINKAVAGSKLLTWNTDIDGLTNVKHLISGNFQVKQSSLPIYNQPDQLIEVRKGDLFAFYSDLTGFRPRVYLYDANRKLITSEPATAPIVGSSFTWNTSGFYSVGSNVNQRSLAVTDTSTVKFIRFAIWAGNALASFEFKTLRVVARFARELTNFPRRIHDIKEPRRLPSLMYATDADVNMLEVGQGIPCYRLDMAAMKINLRRTVHDVVSISGNVLTVTGNPQYANANSVVVYVDSGGVEQSAAVSSIAAGAITLSSAPPSAITAGVRIVLLHTVTKTLA